MRYGACVTATTYAQQTSKLRLVYENTVYEGWCVLIADTPTRVRIVKPPPSRLLEGFNLNPAALLVGKVYELQEAVAERLMVWGYAELLTEALDGNLPNIPRNVPRKA
jgi:hypothetical protein